MGKQNTHTHSRRKKAETLFTNQRFNEARNLFQQICKRDPDDAEAWVMLGKTNARLGKLHQTVECNQKAISLRPDYWEAHYNLGKALLDLGQLDEAEASYRKTVRLNPDWPQAINNLGNILQARNKHDEAMDCYSRALEIKPDYARAHINMGSMLYQLGRDHDAEISFKKALSINPALPGALKNLANMKLSQGKYADAMRYYQRLEYQHPGQVDIPVIKARILERQGQPDKAYDIIKPLIDRGKEDIKIARLFASICRQTGHRSEAIEMLRHVLSGDTEKINDDERATLHFKLGDLYDAEEKYDRAFEQYETANMLKHKVFDCDAFSATVDKLIETYTASFMKNLPHGSNDSERPVFIVGMPRSGTTLVEQILASHSGVYGAGELEDIRLAIADLSGMIESLSPYPDCLVDMTQGTCDQLAQTYLDHLQQISNDERYVINKMPGDFLHLGFISVLFPRARIIHCIRDPLDTCLSCYFSDFQSVHDYAHRLEDLGHYYKDYHRLMQHWHDVLDIPILNISYEALIADYEDVTRLMLGFLNLNWDEACLRFHENKRVINTLSYNQVRQPIYTRSIGRWKHYERYLEPLKSSLLDPRIE